MTILKHNKTFYVISLDDCGRFLIIDSLKNIPNVILKSRLSLLKNIKEDIIPIFVFRDIRTAWLVSEHKRGGSKKTYSLDQYIKKFKNILDNYLEIQKQHTVVITKYEDFLLNKIVTYNRLCNDLNIQFNVSNISNSFREKTTMLSMFDVEKIIKFQSYVDDDQLSYISSKTKDYNKFFNYPYNLSKQDILRD